MRHPLSMRLILPPLVGMPSSARSANDALSRRLVTSGNFHQECFNVEGIVRSDTPVRPARWEIALPAHDSNARRIPHSQRTSRTDR
jgi:hypothetical protein